jgi:hypothetical protein
MSDNDEVKYIWAVEWDNPFTQQDKRGMVFYEVTLLPGVTKEDFEKFLKEEGFPAVGGILTRAIRYNQQYLLKYSEREGPDPLGGIQKDGVAEKLATLCKHTTDKNFYVVMDSGTASEE